MTHQPGFPSKRLLLLLPLALVATPLPAAISCELNNPPVDVPRLFPGSTSFKVITFSFASRGGEPVFKRVVGRLGGVPALYAPLDVPYVLYEVYKGTEKIGYIHGVNQKGQFGVLEVFVSLDLEGRIKAFYLQRVAGSWANKFTARKFGAQFIGMTLKDFGAFDFIAASRNALIPCLPKRPRRMAVSVNAVPSLECWLSKRWHSVTLPVHWLF